MDPKIYQVIHLVSVIFLVAITFRAFAAPTPESRKANLALSGIASLLALVGGFGLMAKLQYEWGVWVFVKIGCWLGLSALAGFAYRAPKSVKMLSWVAFGLVVTAVYMVYVVNPRVQGMG